LYEYLVVLALLENDIDSAAEVIDSVPGSIDHRGPVIIWRGIIETMSGGAAEKTIELSEVFISAIEAGDSWPGALLYVAMLEVAAGRHEQSLATLQRLQEAGYRDYLWLQLLPPFQVLYEEPQFHAIAERMRRDTERQREQVLTAEWLPPELRTSVVEPITP
jgi:hypothetical protein